MVELDDLEQPLIDARERTQLLADLLRSCVELEQLQGASDVVGDRSDWADEFKEELRAVMACRNRVIHGLRLTDRELRHAEWLARRLSQVAAHTDPG